MFERRSLRWPITLGVLMIVTIVVLGVGWVLLTIIGILQRQNAAFYWTWLPIGSVMLVFVLVGVVMYLVLSIKAINLTRRQSNFIDSVTHELKSPIASLKLYLQTLNRHEVSAEQRESFYRFMLEDVERLDTLVSNLLDVARFDRGASGGTAEDVSLEEVLQQSAAVACLRHDVDLPTVSLDVEPCVVHARKVELEMIFRNLIDNAIKYGGDEPQVSVKARVQPGKREGQLVAVVDVSDNGRGVPASMRREIFGRFVRLGQELEREKPGIGLGLYIVRMLIDRLRGRIRVYDRTEGTGATFEVQLPCRRVAGADQNAAARDTMTKDEAPMTKEAQMTNVK